jgi:site-specific recombinase XerD
MIYMENQLDITSSKRYVREQIAMTGDLQMKSSTAIKPAVCFTFARQEGQITDISTNAPLINHFLDLIRMSRAHNTWVSYAHDLKAFFEMIPKPPEAITRADCVTFMKHQDRAGCSNATINRRLAAVSSLFNELHLLDPARFSQNPVRPRQRLRDSQQRSQSLYRKRAQRVPNVLSDDDLRAFFGMLPSWRDRTLVLLMWISCLRISEVVAIQFQDIECSRRSIRVAAAKGHNTRTVFMNSVSFAALNRYLEEERGNLFPSIDHVFVAFKGKARGRPLTVNAVQKMIKYYAHKCHLPHIHAHLFRHTGITQLVQEGMAEPAVREFVGHHCPDSLAPYLHLCDEFVDTEFEQAQAGLNSSHWLDLSPPGGKS